MKVLETWVIPLFSTGNDFLKIYTYDNEEHDNTYYASSQLENTFLTGEFSTGHKLIGQTKVIRNGKVFYLGNRARSNSRNYTNVMNIALYSFETGKLIKVDSRSDMEEKIKLELSH